jgi:hypothetical protein
MGQINLANCKTGGHSIGHGQIRIQIPDVRVLGVRFRREGQDGKGMGEHTPVGCPSPAKRPRRNWRAAPLALSSPLGKVETETQRERREKSVDGRRERRPEQDVFVSTSDRPTARIFVRIQLEQKAQLASARQRRPSLVLFRRLSFFHLLIFVPSFF